MCTDDMTCLGSTHSIKHIKSACTGRPWTAYDGDLMLPSSLTSNELIWNFMRQYLHVNLKEPTYNDCNETSIRRNVCSTFIETSGSHGVDGTRHAVRALIQYKDVILLVKEIPLWR